MYQKTTIIGNLGRDPELKYTNSQMAICSFSVAVTEKIKKNGEWVDATTWFKVVTFGKQAENASKYLAKGSKILADGRIQLDEYTAKDGTHKANLSLVAEKLVYLTKSEAKQESLTGFENYADASSLANDLPVEANDQIPF